MDSLITLEQNYASPLLIAGRHSFNTYDIAAPSILQLNRHCTLISGWKGVPNLFLNGWESAVFALESKTGEHCAFLCRSGGCCDFFF